MDWSNGLLLTCRSNYSIFIFSSLLVSRNREMQKKGTIFAKSSEILMSSSTCWKKKKKNRANKILQLSSIFAPNSTRRILLRKVVHDNKYQQINKKELQELLDIPFWQRTLIIPWYANGWISIHFSVEKINFPHR